MPAILALSAVCAGLMGFAIQRGGTCLVAAVDEVVTERRASRLIAIAEASLLVAAGMVVAQVLGLAPMTPRAFALTGWTIAGGMIMGLGAYVAGACVFGAVARIGNGEAAYVLVPGGFFIGCVMALHLGMGRLPHAADGHSWVFNQSWLFAGPLVVIAGWRAWQTVHAVRRRDLLAYLWSPHVATTVIGVTFVILLLLAGPWNYTDYLAEAARHMARNGANRAALLFALFTGATFGGWTAGMIRPVKPAFLALARCLVGGILLGLGGSLVPGANDGLILLGLPLFYPHAWLAFASMLVAIAAALLLQQRARALARGAGLA